MLIFDCIYWILSCGIYGQNDCVPLLALVTLRYYHHQFTMYLYTQANLNIEVLA